MTPPVRTNIKLTSTLRALLVIGCASLVLTACATPSPMGSGGSSGGSSGGGMSGGGSTGGGSMGGGSQGGSQGGSMGGSQGGSMGGSQGGSMGGSQGGSMGGSQGGSMGGSQGGSMGGSAGGASGGGSMGGAAGGMEGVQTGGDECNDGGMTGGGFGGGMGCAPDPERAEELGKELDKSMGEFDESLGEEQREIASTTRNTEGFDTGSGGNRGGSISLGEQAAGAMGSAGSSTGGGTAGSDAPGEVGGGPLEGMSAQEVEKRTPDDIEAIIDDDIIAKQLREAALSQDDPEKRERMWDEYRKYKGLTGD